MNEIETCVFLLVETERVPCSLVCICKILNWFTALPSYGGVPGGGSSQREATAGGDSPRPGRGHAE